MTGEDYVWFFFAWYSDGWYLAEDSSVSCTRAEMKEAVEGSFYISTQAQNLSPSQEPTISGLVNIHSPELHLKDLFNANAC